MAILSKGDRADRPGEWGNGPGSWAADSAPDHRILEELSDQLVEQLEVDSSGVELRVEAGEVTLTGSVPDQLTRQRVEEVAAGISGVNCVTNRLHVRPIDPATTDSMGSE